MGNAEVLFHIDGIMNGMVCDKGVVYKKGRGYFLTWEGLGVTRQISKKLVKELETSDLRIKE